MAHQIQEVLDGKNVAIKETSHATIFHDALSADLLPEDMSLSRMQQEAMALHGGAVETTSWALTVAVFHILDNPPIKARLKAELTNAMPNSSKILPWDELAELPYLSALIMEGMKRIKKRSKHFSDTL
jgi:cytochrome P450